jgi:hypothetical protein
MEQHIHTPPPTDGYEVEFIPLERRMGQQRRTERASQLPPLPLGIAEDRRKKERRSSW